MYASTRNPALAAGLSEALLQGLAPDGGLYVPRAIATVDDEYRVDQIIGAQPVFPHQSA